MIGDQRTQQRTIETCPDCFNLALSNGNADNVRDFAQSFQIDTDRSVAQWCAHMVAMYIDMMAANMADRSQCLDVFGHTFIDIGVEDMARSLTGGCTHANDCHVCTSSQFDRRGDLRFFSHD